MTIIKETYPEIAIHPLANIFPKSEEMVEKLVTVLQERMITKKKYSRSMAFPVRFYQGQIIDGRCCYEANKICEVPMESCDFLFLNDLRTELLSKIFRLYCSYTRNGNSHNPAYVNKVLRAVMENYALIIEEYSALANHECFLTYSPRLKPKGFYLPVRLLRQQNY